MPKKYFIPENLSLPKRLYLKWVQRRNPVPEFPKFIQLQTQRGCPAKCIFCPNNRVQGEEPRDPMPIELFHRIIDEICEHDSVQRISPYLMNEPLMDRQIGEKIAYIRKRLDRSGGKAVIKINSNAALLDERTARILLDSGLDRISFSVHGIVPAIYEETMVNLKLDKVLRNIDRFLELKREGDFKRPRVRVTMVKTKYLEPQLDEIKRYWGERNIKVNIRGLENRSDPDIEGTMKKFNTRGWQAFSWCTRMFEQAYILNTGELTLCCVDWGRTTIMGRVSETTRLRDIWNGPVYGEMRRRFLAGDLDGTLCATSSPRALIVGLIFLLIPP
jgi:MoaA/NifB/PqqE/SkfB family radical SAM enzyme